MKYQRFLKVRLIEDKLSVRSFFVVLLCLVSLFLMNSSAEGQYYSLCYSFPYPGGNYFPGYYSSPYTMYPSAYSNAQGVTYATEETLPGVIDQELSKTIYVLIRKTSSGGFYVSRTSKPQNQSCVKCEKSAAPPIIKEKLALYDNRVVVARDMSDNSQYRIYPHDPFVEEPESEAYGGIWDIPMDYPGPYTQPGPYTPYGSFPDSCITSAVAVAAFPYTPYGSFPDPHYMNVAYRPSYSGWPQWMGTSRSYMPVYPSSYMPVYPSPMLYSPIDLFNAAFTPRMPDTFQYLWPNFLSNFQYLTQFNRQNIQLPNVLLPNILPGVVQADSGTRRKSHLSTGITPYFPNYRLNLHPKGSAYSF